MYIHLSVELPDDPLLGPKRFTLLPDPSQKLSSSSQELVKGKTAKSTPDSG